MTDRNETWDMGPPSEPPNLREIAFEAVVEAIVEWFFENFEDPARNTPWESGYIYIWGGPYNAREELECAFSGKVSERAIAYAAERILPEGCDWAPSQRRMRPED